jgi:plastocyanin
MRTIVTPRRSTALAITLLTVLGIAACGGDDDDASSTPTGGADEITVVAKDLGFDADSYSADAGEVTISYENTGAVEHTLVIDGVDDFKLDVPAHGDVDESTLQLEAGTYTIYCDVPGHRDAGMEATVEVS